MIKVNETFVSIVGEVNVGRLAYFIRVEGCNLDCDYCDSKYARDEGFKMSLTDIVTHAQYFPRIVITGGEPMLQKAEVAKLITRLKNVNPDVIVEIETNGTIRPTGIKDYNNVIFNVSPKLKNSKNEFEDRIKPDVLSWFNNMNANFKFVVESGDDIDEVSMLVREHGLKKRNIFLMPEGKTADEQWKKMRRTVQHAKNAGYNFSPRLHILLWNNERGK